MAFKEDIRYSASVKRCAKQIVKEFFEDILIGEFKMPSQTQMESYLLENIDSGFDEYQALKKIQCSHPEWSQERIADELEKQKRRYEKEFQHNLKVAAQNAINEVENLAGNLKDTIKAWKIKNLE
ncbi:MAG: hypothetical protein ABIK98_08670 [Pseudomonadota bacterium]|uniref:Uncharacterized protein n=1 Tax=Candidatus Desulfatibia profunda TaxID=2841695 RepID=A0A8J6NSM3_9BACT|nr:hypothetical protein [Candidatus Desulfatibia profunda]MBL7179542.1 hypothetical protein [Desulfobacterales bacterium]MBU0697816.1 hypothetical protein [Pseudomonadota bacterium]